MSLGIRSVAPEVITEPVLAAWQEQIRHAGETSRPLVITGGGSKTFYGRAIDGDTLDATAYRGIVAYEPTELVITARCGTPLAEIEATLHQRGQMLAFEPPHFAGAPTIGGVVAAGLSGPRRMSAGAVRDFVLGVRLMNGHGQLLRFGGQVMKNVAGYDVSRLLAGSLGCLGLLAEVSLKVVPKPRVENTLRFELAEREALAKLNQWAGKPLPISASGWHDGVLHLRLSGAEAGVAAARHKLGGEVIDQTAAESFWRSLRDQDHAFFVAAAQDPQLALIRLSLPDTAPAIVTGQPPLIEWGGAQRWFHDSGDNLQKFRDLAALSGGHATLFRPAAGVPPDDIFTPLVPALRNIHRQLKQVFDPAGIFNRGRLAREF